MNPPERGLAVRRQNTGFMAIMHDRKTVDASHEPVLALTLTFARGLETRSPRLMGKMHDRKAVGASREPASEKREIRPLGPHGTA
jgi:hypothetical protein